MVTDPLPQQAQSPVALLDYGFDYTTGNNPLAVAETITSSTWSITKIAGPTSATPTLSSQGIDLNGFITSVWVTGGVLNTVWRITNHATSSSGRVFDRSFELTIAYT